MIANVRQIASHAANISPFLLPVRYGDSSASKYYAFTSSFVRPCRTWWQSAQKKNAVRHRSRSLRHGHAPLQHHDLRWTVDPMEQFSIPGEMLSLFRLSDIFKVCPSGAGLWGASCCAVVWPRGLRGMAMRHAFLSFRKGASIRRARVPDGPGLHRRHAVTCWPAPVRTGGASFWEMDDNRSGSFSREIGLGRKRG